MQVHDDGACCECEGDGGFCCDCQTRQTTGPNQWTSPSGAAILANSPMENPMNSYIRCLRHLWIRCSTYSTVDDRPKGDVTDATPGELNDGIHGASGGRQRRQQQRPPPNRLMSWVTRYCHRLMIRCRSDCCYCYCCCYYCCYSKPVMVMRLSQVLVLASGSAI